MNNTWLKSLIWICIVGTFLLSILPNIISEYWLIDVFSNFKLQYLFVGFLLLIIVITCLKNKALALVLLTVSLVWNGYFIVPYYIASADTQTTSHHTFKISSINLLSSNSELELVQDYVQKENPDVLVLMELTPRWEKELQPIINDFPFKKLVPRTDNFGIALISKFKMKSSVDYFDLHNKPTIIGRLNIKNKIFSIIATHPVPPINQASFESRNKQLQHLLRRKADFSENVVVIGDFNNSSFSNHFKALISRDLKDSRMGFGLLPTWPAGFSILQTTLDHCLVSKHLNVIDRASGDYVGSDHLPIHLTIGID